ncbi:MAG: hypothetical protein NZM04_03600 [Methylacidiphilales bacterium]|nr:hypothetical protein [Candidatus Methylacidiphilales bacterium]
MHEKLKAIPNPYKPLNKKFAIKVMTCTIEIEVTGNFAASGQIGECCENK